jgi:uncharacterized protein (TIGR04255 family)
LVPSGLQLAEPERVVFERPPLVLAAFEVRFSNLPEVADRDYVEPFRRAIEGDYPELTPANQVTVQFDLAAGQPRQLQTVQWRFTDRGANWTVVLASDFLTLEVRRYGHFEEFTSRLRSVLTALAEHVRPKVGTRLGLRYINEIRVGTEGLGSIVRPEMLGLLSVAEFERHAAQSLQEVVLRFPEDQSIQVRHGFFPDGSTVQPAPGKSAPSGPFYLLDFDASRVFSAPALLEVEPDAIGEHVERYHDEIEKIFRWSMTDQFTESLGVRRRDS